jgi:uncharacterized protein YciI
MKVILIFSVLALSTHFVRGQSIDSLYAVTYTVGAVWDANKSPNDQPYFKEHSARLSQLRKDGVIKVGARFGVKGMIVIAASSLNAAKEIIFSDTAVINKLFVAEVEKMNIFYDGCIERPK